LQALCKRVLGSLFHGFGILKMGSGILRFDGFLLWATSSLKKSAVQVIDYYKAKTVAIVADKSTAEVAEQIRQAV